MIGTFLNCPGNLSWGLFFLTSPASAGGGQLRSQLIHTVDFSTISSIKALNLAWKKFSSGKKSRVDVAEYQKQLKININNLYVDIASGNYEHGKYQPFMICNPKQRQIHKATVRDRLVHQVIVSAIEPLFERQFIYDSYSCRVGKGTHAGVRRFRTFLGQASCNNTQKVYVLKCDVRKFFASIDHETLLRLITRRITDEAILELVRTIVLSHGAETGKGIPLGNVTSQLFANIYLHELDWFIKQTLGIKHYLRYCDDFVIVSTDKSYLQSLIDPIRSFLKYELRLDLHPTKVSIRPWSLGVDFLGHVLLPHATMLRTKTKSRMLARVTEQNLSSYLGICSHVQAYRVSQVVQLVAWQRHEELA
jgi:retron-type reverse transcriptase